MRSLILPVLVCFLISGGQSTDSLGRVNLITKLPFVLLAFTSESQGAGVWIPEEPAKDNDGSVADEYSEVATVFAKPEAKVVQSEVLPSDQAVPWTSLKQEWDLYKKFHSSRNKKSQTDNDSSEEEEEEEEEEDDEVAAADESKLPQAFYGQQNQDDDEKEFFHNEKKIYKRTKENIGSVEESDEEEADVDNVRDDTSLDDIPDSVKQAMLKELLASSKNKEPIRDVQPHRVPINGESEEDDGPQHDGPPGHGGPPPKSGEEEDEEYFPRGQKNKKGDDQDLPQSDHGDGHGKDKGKKKKKKKGKKKGGHGWGWKKPTYIPIPPPHHGWKDHDGLLEQLVKGSTWERVLAYYHQRVDENEQNKGWGWASAEKQDLGEKLHHTSEKLVNKLFKGSFWDRAFQTYQQYKNENSGHPNTEYINNKNDLPLSIDW